jgi:dephospho-CoA kinase
MLVVALTGNIASGKSTVAQMIAAKGVPLIDADVLAREAVEPGSAALARIAGRWGAAAVGPDGRLNRPALGSIVFSNPNELAALNAIIHPEVGRVRAQRLAAARERGDAIVLCDIPLLYEANMAGDADVVIVVDAPVAVRLQRLMTLRALGRTAAQAMIDAQMPSEAKRERADFVIDNAGSMQDLRAQVDRVWRDIERRAATA